MTTQVTFPQLHGVQPLPEKKLFVTFSSGESKIYDCKPLLKEAAFRPLEDEVLFQQARVEPHGYAVIWNDEIDLAESELWINGELAEIGDFL
jgi:hypothetical protein